MNSYTVYLQNGMWGAPTIKADDYVAHDSEFGVRVKFYRDDAIVAEFTGVIGVVKQDVLVAQNVQNQFFDNG